MDGRAIETTLPVGVPMSAKGSQKGKKGASGELPAPGSTMWWKVGVICVLGLALAAGLWFRFDAGRPDVGPLPDLPDLSGHPQALVAHLQQADFMARQQPASSDAVGLLGMAYHADVFYDEAARCYARATALDPEAWRWWYYTALLMEELGASESEALALHHVVRVNPEFTLAWFRLGETQLKSGQYDRAEKAYRRVISDALVRPHEWVNSLIPQSRTFPIYAYASLGLARIAQEQGRLSEAEKMLEKLTRDFPRFGPAHRLLGRVYQELDRVEEGMERTARATFYPPYYPPADSLVDALSRESCSSSFLLKQMGVAKQSQNGAWAEYLGRRALSVNGEDMGAVAGFALLLLKMGHPDEALPYVKRYANAMGDDVGTLVTMGYDLANLGRLEEAAHFVGQALRVDPKSADAHNVMSFVLGEQGKFDEAILHCKAALETKPDDASAHDNMATFLARQGKMDEALRFLRKTVALWPNSAQAHNNLGIFLSRQGVLAEAQKHLETAIQLRPDFAVAHSNLGVALARQGKLAQAQDHLEKALRMQPENAETHNNLGGILISMGALGAAQEHLEMALKIRPDYVSARQNLAILMKRSSN
jgi:Tfp pilus assembly protein PilF